MVENITQTAFAFGFTETKGGSAFSPIVASGKLNYFLHHSLYVARGSPYNDNFLFLDSEEIVWAPRVVFVLFLCGRGPSVNKRRREK